MIQRLLIANRGEIAIRIIRACRELGVETVAVYSDADARAPHVAAADRAVGIGPAPPAESYLSIPNLIAAAQSTGADALHPGYGFLSENPALAEACERARHRVRRTAVDGHRAHGFEDRGAPADGSRPACRSFRERRRTISPTKGLRRAVDRVGLPVLVKASAGGGGKGMRGIHDAGEIDDAVQAARREATAAFGDGTLYVERLIDRPRHIEVQIFGDHHGRIVHLFERECSAQRRHQKVIEESPSPALTPAVREPHHRRGGPRRGRRRLPQRGHGRVPSRARRRVRRRRSLLLPRDEHAPAGRASRDGRRHRPGSRARAAAGRLWRAVAVDPGRGDVARARHRGARLRRRSGAWLPSAGRPDPALPGTENAGRARRLGRRGGQRGLGSLRSDAGQGDRVGRDSRAARPGAAGRPRCAIFRFWVSARTSRSCSACSSIRAFAPARSTRRFSTRKARRSRNRSRPRRPPSFSPPWPRQTNGARPGAGPTRPARRRTPAWDPWVRLKDWRA